MEPQGEDRGAITTLLQQWRRGDRGAVEQLMPLVYAELRRLARRSMRRERPGLTLQPTDVVHEAYLRLARGLPPELENRGHLYALLAGVMRRVLVDHARAVRAARRGGGVRRVPLDLASESAAGDPPLDDLIALDEALDALRAVDERKARVIELRFFCGLDVEETARALGVSVPTVVHDTRMAKACLLDRMGGGPAR